MLIDCYKDQDYLEVDTPENAAAELLTELILSGRLRHWYEKLLIKVAEFFRRVADYFEPRSNEERLEAIKNLKHDQPKRPHQATAGG